MFIKILHLKQTVKTDQTPYVAASDQDLHCLHVPFLWDARHKWVKCQLQPALMSIYGYEYPVRIWGN